MIKAIDQSTIYVQKSEAGVVFCDRNQSRVVTQKYFEKKENLFRLLFAEVEWVCKVKMIFL